MRDPQHRGVLPVGFAPVPRRMLSAADSAAVACSTLNGCALPLVMQPKVEGLDLVAWATANQSFITSQLELHGAILFRGFRIRDIDAEPFVSATSSGALPYTERSSPRTQVRGNIYTSTDHPADQPIFLHNEQSYNLVFPTKIYFLSVVVAAERGNTPLCDTRRVLRRLAPSLRRRFAERKYLYVRNYGGGLGLSWREALQCTQRDKVEAYCRENQIDFEWRGADGLRTRQVRELIARHPGTGERSWFNHATFFNVSTLPAEIRELLLEVVPRSELPNNTYYGDGSEIEPSVLDELRGAYEEEKVTFAWQQGDLLMLDNLLVAHGREPFVGPRKVVAGMADPLAWSAAACAADSAD